MNMRLTRKYSTCAHIGGQDEADGRLNGGGKIKPKAGESDNGLLQLLETKYR